MSPISRKAIGACGASLCLAIFHPVSAQGTGPSAEGSGEENRIGAARGSAATAPMQGGSAATGGRSNAMGDSRASPAPVGRDGAALSHQPDRQDKAKASKGDMQLMRDLATAHIAEIKMSALATSNSGDEAIRMYAQKMLEEHYAALDSLRRTARSLGVILPGGVDTAQAALLRRQAMLTGQEFDRAYLQEAGLALHENAHKLAQAAAKATSPDIRNHGALLLPVIEEHARLAEAMKAEPAKAAATVKASQRAGQSVFLAQGAPQPGLSGNGSAGQGSNADGNKGSASISGRAAGEVPR